MKNRKKENDYVSYILLKSMFLEIFSKDKITCNLDT